MIVVDENSADETVLSGIRVWYRGRVCSIRDLLPGAVIKDEMIPRLPAREIQPTFVTTNVSDFWQLVRADRRYEVENHLRLKPRSFEGRAAPTDAGSDDDLLAQRVVLVSLAAPILRYQLCSVQLFHQIALL